MRDRTRSTKAAPRIWMCGLALLETFHRIGDGRLRDRAVRAGTALAAVLALLASPLAVVGAAAARTELPSRSVALSVDSGVHSGPPADSDAEPQPVFSEIIRETGAGWLRLRFGPSYLGLRSFVTIRSLADDAEQRLDAEGLAAWSGTSAYFNGDAVEVTLHAGPGDAGVFFRVVELVAGGEVPPDALDLCGGDDRVASSDPRIGRIRIQLAGGVGVCTGWLIANGAVLTAGHCADLDPDGGGSQLPDGVLDWTTMPAVLEFDVPASTAGGNWVASDPDDQYAVDLTAGVVWEYDGEGQGLGKDWAVFSVQPNTNTGLTVQQAQGAFFRVTRLAPTALLATIRITGYGSDDGTANYTQQTSTGLYLGEFSTLDGVFHAYQADTMGGNSGGPVIWEDEPGFTVGVHTTGGCSPVSGNSGTSFEHDPLEVAVRDFGGASTVYVDAVSYPDATQNGEIFNPYTTVVVGTSVAPSSGTLAIVAGSYDETLIITKPLTIVAPVGPVTIGR